MAEISANAGMPQRILHALESNQHKEGLTVKEIRQVLGIETGSSSLIYNALRNLIIRRKIQCWRCADNPYFKVYSLPKPDDVLAGLIQESERLLTQEAKDKFAENGNHPLIQQSQLSELLEVLMRQWSTVSSPKEFPYKPGIYAFYSGTDGICLYVGQARSLRSRGCSHRLWEQATRDFESPYAAYKVIEHGHIKKTMRELIYSECLFIGLLRPCWNAATPRPRGDL